MKQIGSRMMENCAQGGRGEVLRVDRKERGEV